LRPKQPTDTKIISVAVGLVDSGQDFEAELEPCRFKPAVTWSISDLIFKPAVTWSLQAGSNLVDIRSNLQAGSNLVASSRQ
jgi:hypothetical protein